MFNAQHGLRFAGDPFKSIVGLSIVPLSWEKEDKLGSNVGRAALSMCERRQAQN
jgi:hypothetical protein